MKTKTPYVKKNRETVLVGHEDVDKTPIAAGQLAVLCKGYGARRMRYSPGSIKTYVIKHERVREQFQGFMGRRRITRYRDHSTKYSPLPVGTSGLIMGRNLSTPSQWDFMCGDVTYTVSSKCIKIIRNDEEFAAVMKELQDRGAAPKPVQNDPAS